MKINLQTRTRLSLTYLAIIMTLSLGFSIIFYHQSMDSAGGGLRRQIDEIRENQRFIPQGPMGYLESIRQRELDRFHDELILKLLLLNILMLAGGGLLSVFLAKKSLRPLEEALEAQSRFSSDAAHELRTPLTSMQSEIEVALRDKKLTTAQAKETLNSILEEIHGLDGLTSALLRLSTYDKGQIEHKNVKIFEVLSKAKERVEKSAQMKNIKLSLPKTKSMTNGDKDQLIEVFVVLFDNAIKYGKDDMNIDIEVEEHHKQLIVSVKDRGYGIANKDLAHIFDRFYRADESRAKQKVSGFGLGLSLAKNIVEAHGGDIGCESIIGEGSTFRIKLPLV